IREIRVGAFPRPDGKPMTVSMPVFFGCKWAESSFKDVIVEHGLLAVAVYLCMKDLTPSPGRIATLLKCFRYDLRHREWCTKPGFWGIHISAGLMGVSPAEKRSPGGNTYRGGTGGIRKRKRLRTQFVQRR